MLGKKKERPKVQITWKLCDELMTNLFCLSYSVTGDFEGSQEYAKRQFGKITSEWELLNGFDFDIINYEEKGE